MLVGLLLVVGVGLIFLLSPPHSVCQDQVDLFKQQQVNFLFLDSEKAYKVTTQFSRVFEKCRVGITLGSCLDLFTGMKKVIRDLDAISPKCLGSVVEIDETKQSLWGTLGLMAQLAWGEGTPSGPDFRQGWLDTSQIFLYCKLKQQAKAATSDADWNAFALMTVKSLKGSSQLPANEAWTRSLFAQACN